MNELRCFLLLMFLISGLSCFGQSENINTDRPDQSDGVYTIPKNKMQIENGILLKKETVINNFMLRYGVTKTTEVRLLADIGKEDAIKGIKPLTLSVKQRIINEQGLIPAITFVGYVSFPKIATRDFQSTQIPFELKLVFDNPINDRLSVFYNVGVLDEFNEMSLSSGLAYALADKISTFVEYFSSLRADKKEHNLDAGILYLINSHFQVDLSFGRSIFDKECRFFTTSGVSYLLKK